MHAALSLLLPTLWAAPAAGQAPAAAPAAAPAEPTPVTPRTWAVVVGSNRPGPGQAPLRYAVTDAERVADVFVELGDVDPGDVLLLADPDPDEVLAALDGVAAEVAARGGAPSRVLFYYSGHARASGLDLGGEQLPLTTLRDRLESLPATVRLAVLDACQSGAVTEAKGLSPAAAFSTASVRGLDAEGLAVIASSTGTELSQESDALQGSTFTHHLVTGLRGAADEDTDGLVTLDEAYRYAYDRTVVSTSVTAIGRQHPTLETDLRGRGALALTRPGRATARLHFGPDDAGEILLVDQASDTVAAEVSKAPGDALTLALAPGAYGVIWRAGEETRSCTQQLAEGRSQLFAPVDCVRVEEEATDAKGGGEAAGPALLEDFAVELGIGGVSHRDDAYTDTLEDFGYSEGFRLGLGAHAQAVWTLHPHLSVVGNVASLESRSFSREVGDPDEITHRTDFRWGGSRYGVLARGNLPVLDGWLVPYLQTGGGPAMVRTVFDDTDRGGDDGGGAEAPDPSDPDITIEQHWGWHLAAGGGVQLMPAFGRQKWRHLGLYLQAEWSTVHALDNLLGDRHDTGGLAIDLGVRAAF